jgi:ankyrin repeat protein
MEHDVLIRELPELENWPLAKRMKQAKIRRRDQLRKWREREDATEGNVNYELSQLGRKVVFEPSVALLESAARNDTAEVIRLLADGADANLSNPDGLTALHQVGVFFWKT